MLLSAKAEMWSINFSNTWLSYYSIDTMFPSILHEDYAISKTFLILYRNEEIILDDCIVFKISTIVNILNVSFKNGNTLKQKKTDLDLASWSFRPGLILKTGWIWCWDRDREKSEIQTWSWSQARSQRQRLDWRTKFFSVPIYCSYFLTLLA